MSSRESTQSVEQELNAIEQQLAAAWVAGDPSFHERVLADDWRVIDGSGRILTKAQVLAEMFGPGNEVTGTIDDVKVRPYGNWAIVTGRTHVTGRYEGNEIDVTLRFTDVFRRTGGNWQVLASQATMLKT